MKSRRRYWRSSRAGLHLALGVLLGEFLGAVVGVMEGAHHLQVIAAAKHDDGYASDVEDDDALVAWPLLGMLAGAIAGAGAIQLGRGLSRVRGQTKHLSKPGTGVMRP